MFVAGFFYDSAPRYGLVEVSKNFRTSPAGASPPTSPTHGAYKFKRQPTGDVLAIDRIKEIHAEEQGKRWLEKRPTPGRTLTSETR